MNTKNFNLSQLMLNSSSKESVINENNFFIDSLMLAKAIDFIDTLPESPKNGDVYIVSKSSTNLTSSINKIVIYNGNFGFKFIDPQENMIFFIANQSKSYIFKNNTWGIFQSSSSSGGGSGTNDYNELINKPNIPSKTSDLTNDSNFQTSAQVVSAIDSKISQIPTVIDDSLTTGSAKTYSIDKIKNLVSSVSSSGDSGSSSYNLVPYAVNSAKTDSNGRANFITKVSNTEISFDTNSGSTPINITYPDGSFETNSILPNITGISTDGTYYVIKEKTGSPYLTILQPVERYVAPSSPSNGQLWLDISVMPYAPKKWNGSSWVVAQFVKLGEFTRTSGVIGTPISYALNGRYVSPNTSFAYGSAVNISHNLGVNPIFIKETIHVVNISTEYGYLPGETLMGAVNFNASTDPGSISAYALQSALLGINNSRFTPSNTTGYGGIRGVYRNTYSSTPAITPANWRIVFIYTCLF